MLVLFKWSNPDNCNKHQVFREKQKRSKSQVFIAHSYIHPWCSFPVIVEKRKFFFPDNIIYEIFPDRFNNCAQRYAYRVFGAQRGRYRKYLVEHSGRQR